MKRRISLILTVVFAATLLLSGCAENGSKTIVVGAKDYTEQDILGNILTVLIEKNTDIKVDYKHEMSSNVLFAAAQSGDIDVWADYTGTIYGNYLNYSEMKTAEEVYDISAAEMKEKYSLSVLEPLGFNNTYCLAVRPETAAEFGLKTYSDLAKVSADFIFGGSFEILNRNDGIPNLKKAYGMTFKEETALDGVLRYFAIEQNDTQVTEAFSTDGMLIEYDLVVLEDDKSFFPPYHSIPVIRDSTAEKYPEVVAQLERLAGAIDDDTMRGMNYKVDVLKENPRDVAVEFLTSAGLIG